MKTAISIPDPIFEKAEKMAKNTGVSRSKLYTTAIIEYLDAHRASRITKKLNEVYEGKKSRLDSKLSDLQTTSLDRDDEW